MKRLKEYKLAMLCLKYIPVLMFLLMWGYTLLGLFGIQLVIVGTIVGCSLLPSILILSLSQVFKFCWLHKILIIYSFTADMLINISIYLGSATVITSLQLFVILVGFIIFIMLILKQIKSKE